VDTEHVGDKEDIVVLFTVTITSFGAASVVEDIEKQFNGDILLVEFIELLKSQPNWSKTTPMRNAPHGSSLFSDQLVLHSDVTNSLKYDEVLSIVISHLSLNQRYQIVNIFK